MTAEGEAAALFKVDKSPVLPTLLRGMQLDHIKVVLVSPLYGGNVGSVCRAMENMGLSDLAIAAPRDDVDWDEAVRLAYRADGTLAQRREFATTADAVADCSIVAGTTARKGFYRSHAKTPREWAPFLVQKAQSNKVAILFGPEDKGLCNEDLALCTQIIEIPSTDNYPSLNLSHAVMVCAYELFLASGQFEASTEVSTEADSEFRELMFEKWRQALLDIGFMKEDKAPHMMMGLRRILSRGSLTENDVKILIGIAQQAQWCAGQAGLKTEVGSQKSEVRGQSAEGRHTDTDF
ncbi:MAG: RNA methyltransferase [Verrucomicrobia bacterium]|nr:RNA methyltransferase [Verrucomicrobiota bacterium]